MSKMNPKIKKIWVKALKSGKYKQGKEKLCYGNQNGSYFCCLGVLSDIAVKEGICSRKTAFKGNSILNKKVMEWSGLTKRDPNLFSLKTSCSEANDSGNSFDEIGNAIDKSL